MKEIEVNGGLKTMVDDDMYERLNGLKWYCHKGYVVNRSARGGLPKKWIRMHRVVNNTPDGMLTDHIDGNRLNNQKHNLRTCTQAQNNIHKVRCVNKTTGFKGVYWDTKRMKYRAKIMHKKRPYCLGWFGAAKDAAAAYNDAAIKLHGEYAHLNDIEREASQ